MPEFTIVSIGTLSSNPFWKEAPGLRTPHATTTLVRDQDRLILVDPSLPGVALAARLFERTGLRPEQITDVVCTNLRPTHRRAMSTFPQARWLASDVELNTYRQHLNFLAEAAHRAGRQADEAIGQDLELLERFEPIPERITDSVHLYPLPGPSAGSAGLLLADPIRTVVIAGDAALTADHVLAGRVWEGCANTELAAETLAEVLEIADIIVCGHDNYMICPLGNR